MGKGTRENGILEYRFEDDVRIPNNPNLPLLVYPGALGPPSASRPAARSGSPGTDGEAPG